jgi:hypothetical protein
MDENNLTLDGIIGALLSAFPELEERIRSTFGSYYDLQKGTPEETPGAYLIFEDVVMKLVVDLLVIAEDEKLISRLFAFFEEMAKSTDPDVSQDLLGIAILEPLVYEKDCLRAAWRFMGPKMRELAVVEAHTQGRQENLPTVL